MHLTLHLSRTCNLRCDYCYAPPAFGEVMDLATARDALRLGAESSSGSVGIVFFGGEPLLHKDLLRQVVAEAQSIMERGEGAFHFKVTTNGLLLDEDFLDFSITHDILIAMSFDGVAAAQDRHRKMPDASGTFACLLPRLRLLLAARPYASVLMVVNPDTVQFLHESVLFLAEQGARYLVVSLNYAATWNPAALAELERQYHQLGALYIAWCREDRKFYLSPLDVKLASHIADDAAHCQQCELGMRQLSVDPQGFLFPCVQFTQAGPDSRWCIGHVNRGIDQSARQRLRNESQAEKEPCCRCTIRDRCQNTCGCLNWQSTGSVCEVSPVLCQSERILTRVADDVGAQLFAEKNTRFIQKHYNPAYPIVSLLEDFG